MSFFDVGRGLVRVAAAGVFTVAFALPEPALSGTCRKAVSEAKVDEKNSARFRELQCQLDADPSVKLSVKFQTLGETAASVLLYKGKAPFTERLYGKTKVLENAVLKEYRTLLDKFGIPERYESTSNESNVVGLHLKGAEQVVPENYEERVLSGTVKAYRLPLFLTGPLYEEVLRLLKTPTWPSGFNLRYFGDWDQDTDAERSSAGVNIWRYATRDDFVELPIKLHRYNQLILPRDRANREELDNGSRAAAGLFVYVMRNGSPPSFLRFQALVGEGCGTMDFELNWLAFEVDAAIIHNASDNAISLDELLGSEEPSANVRPSLLAKASPTALPLASVGTLAPRESLIVPLRLRFRDNEFAENEMDSEARVATAENRSQSKQRYEHITATRPGTTFKFLVTTDIKNDRPRGPERNTYWIVKTRESFTPHTEPEIKNHIYGPEWQLAAVKVGGETIVLDDAETDVVDFTADSGVGSCPVLYVWSEEEQHWERRGKVIHKAQGKANAQSETVRFSGWQPRFRIVEEELEVAHLDAISAVIALDDGTTRDLSPPRSEAGGTPLTLPASYYYAEGTEVVFELPEGVDPQRVAETRLTVSGYYERYSSLLVEKYGRTRDAAPKSAATID